MSAPPTVDIVPLDVDLHGDLMHAWVTHPRSAFWQMQDATPEEVRAEYARLHDDPHHDAFLGTFDGVPTFVTETYDPRQRELVGVPEVRDGDLGMHVLVAPPSGAPIPGLTRAVFAAVMRFCFADERVHRVVVEPDVRNDAIAALNRAAGFRVLRVIALPTKTAALSACTRSDFAHSNLGDRR